MKIVGVDPSLRLTGIGVIEGAEFTSALIPTSVQTPFESLCILYHKLSTVFWDADLVVIESDIVVPGRGRAGNQLGKVQGVITVALYTTATPYMYVAPVQLRSFTGAKKGQKSKPLGPHKMQSDQIDAGFLALMGAMKLGYIEIPAHVAPLLRRLKVETPPDVR